MRRLSLLLSLSGIFCITSCDRESQFEGSNSANINVRQLYTEAKRIELPTDHGYIVNQVTGDTISPFLNSNRDTIVTGKPFPVVGQVINPNSVNKPTRVKAGKPRVVQADQNKYKVPERLNVLTVNHDELTVNRISNDSSSRIEDESKDSKFPTGIAFPAKGKVVRALQPEPIVALPPKFRDNATRNIQYLDVDEGMNSSYVLAMLMDRRGNLWIGTQSGLSRYDGEYFTHYSEKNGLLNNYITCILEDDNGNIWFGCYGGFSKFDGTNFTHFSRKDGLLNSYVTSILKDKNGNIWFGSKGGGVGRYDGENITNFTEKEGLSSNITYSLCEDKSGNIWIGTYGAGANRYNGETFTHFRMKDGLLSDYISCMLADRSGNIWFGSYKGACMYNGKSITHYTEEEGLSDNDVYDIHEDKTGNIWFATNLGGVNRFDGEHIIQLTEKQGLSSNTVKTVIEDKIGNLWFGTYGGGINRYKEASFNYLKLNGSSVNNGVKPIFEDRNGDLWFGAYGDGICRYDGNSFSYFTEKEGLISNYIVAICEDRSGNLWFGSNEKGFCKYDGEYFTHFSEKEGLSDNRVWSIIEDKSGNIWCGTRNGACRYDGQSFTHFSRKEGLISKAIYSITEDNEGSIWFASRGGGVSKYVAPVIGEVGSITHYTEKEGLLDNRINAIHQDRKGNYWLTSWAGLSMFDGESFTNYTAKEGLNGKTAWSISEDNKGDLWIGTEKGLFLFSGKTREVDGENIGSEVESTTYQIASFAKSDGLKALDFKLNSVYLDSYNNQWWSAGKYMVKLDLNEFTLEKKPPMVELNYLEVNEKMVDFNNLTDSVLSGLEFDSVKRFYNYPINLKLDYRYNHLAFYFSAIDWSAPHKILYTYRIQGLSEEWSNPSGSAFADYRNLPYGTYSLNVMALGESQQWSEPFEFEFTILPPWWHTWWARTLYVALAVLILMGYGRFRTGSLNRRKKELESEVTKATEEIRKQKDRAEQSEQFKQQFLANMSHEIRTPMNAILGMTKLTLETPLEEKQLKYLNAIKNSSDNLLVIINDILDLSKLEAGKMEFEHITFRLDEQIQQVYDTLRFKAEEKSLAFNTEIAEDVPNVLIGDPSRLKQALINICGNAIKFTDSGTVSILVELVSGTVGTIKYTVRDTGIGISKEQVKKLFTAFQQADSSTSRKYGGTGLGLSISKNLIELQDGTIEVESEEGKGTSFIVTIPYIKVDENVLTKEKHVEKDISTLKGIKILVAEDNEFNQIVINDTLEKLIEGVQVDIAENGVIAVEMYLQNEYDVILMDVNMPEMDGHDATKQIRLSTKDKKKNIPIIALTASVLKSEVDKCIVSGMDGFVPKPFKNEELLEALKKYYPKAKT